MRSFKIEPDVKVHVEMRLVRSHSVVELRRDRSCVGGTYLPI